MSSVVLWLYKRNKVEDLIMYKLPSRGLMIKYDMGCTAIKVISVKKHNYNNSDFCDKSKIHEHFFLRKQNFSIHFKNIRETPNRFLPESNKF